MFLLDVPTLFRVAANIIFCDFPENSVTLHVKVELNIQRCSGLFVSSIRYILSVGGREICLDSYRKLLQTWATLKFLS
jgi:hypothetical protein